MWVCKRLVGLALKDRVGHFGDNPVFCNCCTQGLGNARMFQWVEIGMICARGCRTGQKQLAYRLTPSKPHPTPSKLLTKYQPRTDLIAP